MTGNTELADSMGAMQARADAAWKRWGPRATYRLNFELPPKTWTVDGEVQEVDLTEANLDALLLREGRDKKVVEVSPPLHLVLARITGRGPRSD